MFADEPGRFILACLLIPVVVGIVWLLEKFDIVDYPVNASKLQVYGVALLCGIGFTMSLFIGNLAYSTDIYLDEVKLGVLGGSILSGIAGAIILSVARSERRKDDDEEEDARQPA